MDLISVTTLDQKGRDREMGRGRENGRRRRSMERGREGRERRPICLTPGRWVSLEPRR